MNINELEKDILRHKEKSPETFNDIVHITIPFYMFYNKIVEGVYNVEEQYGISNSELDVLASLIMSGNEKYILSPTKLYERLLFTSGAITKVLQKLEKKNYIIRLDNEFDKRSKLVQITPLGKEICQKTLKEVLLYEEQCFASLNKEEKDTFKNLLIKIMKNL